MGVFDEAFKAAEEVGDTGDGTYEPMPVGDYELLCVECGVVPTKKNPDNLMVKIQWQVLGTVAEPGKHKGRRVFCNYMIKHPSQKALAIAGAQLKKLGKAAGFGDNSYEPEDLQNKTVYAELKIEDKGDYGLQNVIRKYHEEKPATKTESVDLTEGY